MKIKDSLKSAVGIFQHGKLRSALTMLGIVIGIASVIILMSIGQSAQDYILNQVQSVGSNLVFIIPGGSTNGRLSSPAASQGIVITSLRQQDIDALKREPSIDAAVPQVRGQADVVYGDNDVRVTYEGATADFFSVLNYKTQKGYPFVKDDVDSSNHVAVIGSALAETLFGQNINPINKSIRLGNSTFRIVGVLEKKGTGAFGIDQDNLVLIPITVAQGEMLGINYFQSIVIQANAAYDVNFVKSRITSVMRQNHGITDPNKDDFTIETQEDILAVLGSITSVMTLFLAAIASISLVVGGIGIMNIMLVSVVERTREIGLRKAVGATENDILQQFLVESVTLTFLGGVIGVAFGALIVGAAYLILTNFISGWSFELPLSAVFLAVLVSTITGMVFGIYPARQAARKNPIEALRYE